MSRTLYHLKTEYDEDGHRVEVYEDQTGFVERVTYFPTVDYLHHQTKVLAAEELLYQQRTRTLMARSEYEDVRHLIEQRRDALHRQLGRPEGNRALPSPPEIIPPRRNGRA